MESDRDIANHSYFADSSFFNEQVPAEIPKTQGFPGPAIFIFA